MNCDAPATANLLGYEVTPGDDNTGPCTEKPRYQALVNAVNQHRANHPDNPPARD